jgi:hypothetical protein
VYASLRTCGVGATVVAPHVVIFEFAARTAGWDGGLRPPGSPGDRRVVALIAKLVESIEKLGFYFLAYLQVRI